MSNYTESRASTGIPGLDDVLAGGLPEKALYLVHGRPGVGKTTLAMQFLLEGKKRGEKVLYVALTESRDEVLSAARTHGWSLDGVSIFELGGADKRTGKSGHQTMFYPAELELEETIRPIIAEAERIRPTRLVLDSLSEVRLLAQEPLRYRRQLLALKAALLGLGCTVLFIDTVTPTGNDILETIVAGSILLENRSPIYGTARRRLIVDKLGGSATARDITTTRSRPAASWSSPGSSQRSTPAASRASRCRAASARSTHSSAAGSSAAPAR